MNIEIITKRDELLIRRLTLEPGEAMHWHTDRCQKFTVVVRGSKLGIQYRDERETRSIAVHPGLADWDKPEPRIHRAINLGTETYEEVVTFYVDTPGMEPQPIHE